MIYWWNSMTFPRVSMITVIFHDFLGLKIPFLNSMTFQDAWEPWYNVNCQVLQVLDLFCQNKAALIC